MAKIPKQSAPPPHPFLQPEEPPVAIPVIKECANCRHWKQVGQTQFGKCTASPPQIVTPVPKEFLTEHGPIGMFPITTLHTHCGSHSLL